MKIKANPTDKLNSIIVQTNDNREFKLNYHEAESLARLLTPLDYFKPPFIPESDCKRCHATGTLLRH